MVPDTDPGSIPKDVYRYSGVGCMFAASVILFMGGGWLVDKWLKTLPVFTLIGAAIGAVLGTLSMWHRLMPQAKRPEEEDDR